MVAARPVPVPESPDMIQRISCQSAIESVVVYSRGAQVKRRINVPTDLPSAEVELVIPDVSALAEAGSVRVELEGAREVIGIRTRLQVPLSEESEGTLRRELIRLVHQRDAQQSTLAALRQEKSALSELVPRSVLGKKKRDPGERVGDALTVGNLADGLIGEVDRALATQEQALRQLERKIHSCEVAAAQASEEQVRSRAQPNLEVLVRLAAVVAEQPVQALTCTYSVPAARWWPTYTARLSDQGKRAELALEAFVAQNTLEDWTDVQISLSTADLIRDVRLPELHSLRLGKAQPTKRSGYRDAPGGLDLMFASYDESFTVEAEATRTKDATTVVATTESSTLLSNFQPPSGHAMPVDIPKAECAPCEDWAAPDEEMMRAPPPEFAAQAMPAAPMRAKRGSLIGSAVGGAVGAVAGGFAAGAEMIGELAEGRAMRFGAVAGMIEPTDAWLDFDALVMGDSRDSSARGRLVHVARESILIRIETEVMEQIESVVPPSVVWDPRDTRGYFDHRYDGEGTVDVLSNAKPHRLSLTSVRAESTPRLITVPVECADVFREVSLENPFEAPLLAGPVDVFVEGALVTTANLRAVDRKGRLTIGLGVEDRVRVARNVRVKQSSTGILGGTTAVDHEVEIELSSALGHEIMVDVMDRIPISDDKAVEVELIHSEPSAERYKQKDRDAPMKGGLRWSVSLGAGGKQRIRLKYRINLPSKSEIVGGNRRA